MAELCLIIIVTSFANSLQNYARPHIEHWATPVFFSVYGRAGVIAYVMLG